MAEKKSIATIILAAGESKRFGSPKQLAPLLNKPLLQHAIDAAIASQSDSVTVILGAHEGQIKSAIDVRTALALLCAQWREGLSASIRTGIQSLPASVEAALLMLGDQPFVSAAEIDDIIHRFIAERKLIVASKYGDTFGVPALFDKSLFPELCALSGDSGARVVIERHLATTSFVPIPEGAHDIDTPEDLARLEYEVGDSE